MRTNGDWESIHAAHAAQMAADKAAWAEYEAEMAPIRAAREAQESALCAARDAEMAALLDELCPLSAAEIWALPHQRQAARPGDPAKQWVPDYIDSWGRPSRHGILLLRGELEWRRDLRVLRAIAANRTTHGGAA